MLSNSIKMEQFGGLLPAWEKTLLPPAQGAAALNSDVFTGDLVGWRRPALLRALTNSAAAFVYRVPDTSSPDNSITAVAKWLEFEDPDTKVMRSQVVDDQYHRYYTSSPSQVPKYNTYDRIQNDQPFWLLGLDPPGCNPGVEVTGGGNALQLGLPNATIGGDGYIYANTMYFHKITPDAAMSLDDISFVPNTTLDTAQFYGVLYDDIGDGRPHQLLNTTSAVQGATQGTTIALSFINPTGLLSGLDYWIGIASNATIDVIRGDPANTNTSLQVTNTFTNGAPTIAPAPSATGLPDLNIWADCTSEATLAARAYVYTWVTEYGEESAPSPYTLVNGWNNGSWTLSMYTPTAANMGVDRNITKTRIYRTITGSTGLATYFFVAEIDVVVETYIDVIPDDIVALNNQIQSSNWFPPPEDLRGIVSMANGMSVGFRANEVWFCEPYHHHAWPPGYVITTEFPVVGLGIIGQSLIVCTTSNPYVVTGVSPASMAADKLDLAAPCTSQGSIVASDTSVAYHSPDGLVQINANGAISITTDLWVTRDKWRALTPPESVRAVVLPTGYYFAFGSVKDGDTTYAQDGFLLEISPADAPSFAVLRHPGKNRIGFIPLSAPGAVDIKNLQIDPWTGIGLLVQGGNVYYYDYSNPTPDRMPYLWRSKIYLLKYKLNFSAMKVFMELDNAPTLNPTRMEYPTDDVRWNTLDADRYGIIRVYADGNLVTVRELRASGELMRILSEFKADQWQFEVESNVPIFSIQIAESAKLLRFI